MSDTLKELVSDLEDEVLELRITKDRFEDKVAGRAEVDLSEVLSDLTSTCDSLNETVTKLERSIG